MKDRNILTVTSQNYNENSNAIIIFKHEMKQNKLK